VGLLFKVVLGRYVLVFLLVFFGLSFIVTLAAFLLFVLTVPRAQATRIGERMGIGRRLYELGEAKGLTQGGLRNRAGLASARISQLENGHVAPSLALLESWRKALDVELYQLFFMGDRKPEAPKLPEDIPLACSPRTGRPAIARMVLLSALAMLMLTSAATALNPTLDISQYGHTVWTLRDGLFKGRIEAMAQTTDGYLWLGTEFGLLRFDGARFVPWKFPAGQHISDNFVAGLLAARDGSLWIGTRKGLAHWKDGQLTDYPELAGHPIYELIEDHAGTVWTGTVSQDAGKQLCAIQSRRVQCYGNDGRLGKRVLSIYEDAKANLWVVAETGLWRWRPGPPKLYADRDLQGQMLAVSGKAGGTPWVATDRVLKQLVPRNRNAHPLPAIRLQFRPKSLLLDRDGGVWVGTLDQGLVHMRQGRVDRFTRIDGLSSNTVSNMIEDREGNIWVATVSGLDRFRDLVVATVSARQGLSNDYVHSVLAAHDGGVWIATLDGLNRWKDEAITIYRRRRARAARREAGVPVVREVTDDGLPSNDVQALFEDSRGRIWVSARDGIAYFEKGRFVRVKTGTNDSALSITGSSSEDLWISTVNGGLVHLLQGRVAETIPWRKLGAHEPAFVLFDSERGGLWLGFTKGGVSYFAEGEVRQSYGPASGLGEGRISGLQLDRDGTFWASTEGGLSRVKYGRVAALNDKNGLPCSTVHWSIEDDSHSLWLHTSCGLVRIARSELVAWTTDLDNDPNRVVHVTVFDNSDGVPSYVRGTGFAPLVSKATDGKVWFATVDGAAVIDPRRISLNTLPPPVHIEQVTADGKTYDVSSELRLPPLVRDLQLDFTALSLVAPEKVRFQYMLEGRDHDWRDSGTRRQAYYAGLPPGHYRFLVKACNNDGVWNETGASFDFSIAAAYFQTNWFRLACVCSFLASLWWLHGLRLRRIALQFSLRADERVRERTRIARELHDTLLQSFQGLVLRFQTAAELLPARPLEAKQTLEGALERADEAICEGRDAVHDLRSGREDAATLLQAVTTIAEELATNGTNTSGSRFSVVEEGTSRQLRPLLCEEIYRIAREALWNAFTHARARLIQVEITYRRSTLRLCVRDNGVGINAEVLDRGGSAGHWGLPGMRERAKRIGGQLNVWSRPHAGTEIELTIPGTIAYEPFHTRTNFRLFRNRHKASS
jgi:signal transduction histidine kinase/ligand-binding sensor domain-containing protein/transcriptional regulator with XRE-family HTH domain